MKIQKVLIVEDEKPNADRLKRLLLELRPHLEILSVEDSVASTVQWLKTHDAPDMIMMDIRLSDGLSFEIFNRVEVDSPVLFTTAYDEYAVRAFKYNSVDYLLKPIEKKELERAIYEYEKQSVEMSSMSSVIEGVVNFLQPKEYRKRFLLPYRDGYKTLLTQDILYFQTEMGCTKAQVRNTMAEGVPHTLEELEQQLDPNDFFRVNRQFIVHVDAIQNIFNHFNGKLKLQLKQHPEEIEILVSREKASLLKAWLDF